MEIGDYVIFKKNISIGQTIKEITPNNTIFRIIRENLGDSNYYVLHPINNIKIMYYNGTVQSYPKYSNVSLRKEFLKLSISPTESILKDLDILFTETDYGNK